MIREDRFVQSHRPYAVDMGSLRADPMRPGRDDVPHWFYVDAVWFRRRSGVTVACFGDLHTIQRPAPGDAREFLERYTDGRYGGTCMARWDGDTLWAPEATEDDRADYLAVLRPMLANYPDRPPSYDGWWTFRAPNAGGSRG